MQILFAIAVLSCSALVWAAISITKHIRHSNRQSRTAVSHTTSELLDFPGQAKKKRQDPHPREDFASGLASRLSQNQLSPATTRKSPSSVRPDFSQEKANGTSGSSLS